MVKEAVAETSELAERCRGLSTDGGLDSGQGLRPCYGTTTPPAPRPLIETRELWREEKAQPGYDPSKPITRPLYPERVDTIVYTEKGSVHCICPVSGARRDLAFQGVEAERDTLRYRSPAAAYALDCTGREACSRFGGVAPGDCGPIVRIKLEAPDRRIFTPTHHGSPSWQRGYNRRSALDRVN